MLPPERKFFIVITWLYVDSKRKKTRRYVDVHQAVTILPSDAKPNRERGFRHLLAAVSARQHQLFFNGSTKCTEYSATGAQPSSCAIKRASFKITHARWQWRWLNFPTAHKQSIFHCRVWSCGFGSCFENWTTGVEEGRRVVEEKDVG
jgi:hypothetical protein